MAILPSPPSLLVGRGRERSLLRAHLDAALGGHGSLVLIGGEAGIGKTALAEGLCREAAEQGALVLVGRCYDLAETPPYGPWVELFGRYRREDGLPPRPDAFAERRTVGAVPSQAALIQQACDFFASLSAQRPVVLLLEDAHWQDAASADLLRVVARNVAGHRILALATYRSEEMTRHRPLSHLLPLLVREAGAERLELRGLDERAIRTLVADRYPLRDADLDQLVAYLQRRTEGNALFLAEVLRSLDEGHVLAQGVDGWRMGDLAHAAVPPLLRQVIDARLGRLDAEAQRLLTLAAVIGQEVPFALWASVAGVDEAVLLDAVGVAVTAHILVENEDGSRASFTHALIREALYEGTRPSQRRAWHRTAGEVLAAVANADPDQVAHHFRQAGDGRAAAWLVTAGERAKRAHAWLTAADRFETALSVLEERGADADDRGWLLLRLAGARRYSERGRGIRYLERAAQLAEEAGDPALAAYTRRNRGWFHCLSGNTGRGLPDLEAGIAAQEALGPADLERLRAGREAIGHRLAEDHDQAARVLWNVAAGRYTVASAVAKQVLTHQPTTDSGDLYFAVAQIHAMLGRPEEAQRSFVQSRDAYAKGHYIGVGQVALYDLAWRAIPYHPERLAERERIAAEGEEYRMRARGVMKPDESSRLARLPLLILEGQWGEARDLAMGVRAAGRNFNYLPATTALCILAREQGEGALAWELIREILPAGLATEPGDIWFMEAVRLQRVAADLAMDEGDLPAACKWLEAHDRWMDWNGAVLGQSEGQALWAAYYRATGDPRRARRHANAALHHATAPRQPLALLAAHRLLGELDGAAGRRNDAADHLAAALALAERCAAPYERALTLLAMAALHAATNRHADARKLLDEGRAICLPLGATPALARADALAQRLGDPPSTAPASTDLTPREIEVLRLLAGGSTIRAIADELFLSPRTVERHITTIYRKIGARGRVDATAYALGNGLTAAPRRDS